MERTELENKYAEKVYDLLMEYSFPEDDFYKERNKLGFCSYWKENLSSLEYRFQGIFGFGGKFHCLFDRRTKKTSHWFVSYYPENTTPYLDEKLGELNDKLKKLEESYNEESSQKEI